MAPGSIAELLKYQRTNNFLKCYDFLDKLNLFIIFISHLVSESPYVNKYEKTVSVFSNYKFITETSSVNIEKEGQNYTEEEVFNETQYTITFSPKEE